jgi:hypothetical protein
MDINLVELNWLAILVCVVVGQILLTVCFVALFAKPWAREYGIADPKRHSQELPGYTYAIGAGCVLLLCVGMASLQASLGVSTVSGGLTFGAFVALHFSLATALPGYAFLKRYRAFLLAWGSQALAILVLSTILAVWK